MGTYFGRFVEKDLQDTDLFERNSLCENQHQLLLRATGESPTGAYEIIIAT